MYLPNDFDKKIMRGSRWAVQVQGIGSDGVPRQPRKVNIGLIFDGLRNKGVSGPAVQVHYHGHEVMNRPAPFVTGWKQTG